VLCCAVLCCAVLCCDLACMLCCALSSQPSAGLSLLQLRMPLQPPCSTQSLPSLHACSTRRATCCGPRPCCPTPATRTQNGALTPSCRRTRYVGGVGLGCGMLISETSSGLSPTAALLHLTVGAPGGRMDQNSGPQFCRRLAKTPHQPPGHIQQHQCGFHSSPSLPSAPPCLYRR